MRVFGQPLMVDWTCALMSLAPMSISVSAGERPAYRLTFLLTLDRSALTKLLPTTPAPGDSSRPRANTSSTSEHEADAFGISVAGASIKPAARMPAAHTPRIDRDARAIERSFMTRQ